MAGSALSGNEPSTNVLIEGLCLLCKLLSCIVWAIFSPSFSFKFTSGDAVLLDAVRSPPLSAQGLFYMNGKVLVALSVPQRGSCTQVGNRESRRPARPKASHAQPP